MILDAIYQTISGIVAAYPIVGDIEAECPFAAFQATPDILKDKNGINGYDYLVEIAVIDREITELNTYTENIIAAITAMSGTINATIIDAVLHTDESGIYYNDADNVYRNDLEFKILTLNR